MHSLCVFCGSKAGRNPIFTQTAMDCGIWLARHGVTLVYGGGDVGLMGLMATQVMQNQGRVIGVIPRFLMKAEVAHFGLTQLKVVENMHQRKEAMYEAADAFLVLPGGLGTMDEAFEIITWRLLGLHAKPVGILNTNGYYDHLLKLLDHMQGEGFVNKGFVDQLLVGDQLEGMLELLSKELQQQNKASVESRIPST